MIKCYQERMNRQYTLHQLMDTLNFSIQSPNKKEKSSVPIKVNGVSSSFSKSQGLHLGKWNQICYHAKR